MKRTKLDFWIVDVAGFGTSASCLYVYENAILKSTHPHQGNPDDLLHFAAGIALRLDRTPAENRPTWIGVDFDALGAGFFAALLQMRTDQPESWAKTRLVKI